MTKNQRQASRKPATKFPNLRKKMEKQKAEKVNVQTKKLAGKKK